MGGEALKFSTFMQWGLEALQITDCKFQIEKRPQSTLLRTPDRSGWDRCGRFSICNAFSWPYREVPIRAFHSF